MDETENQSSIPDEIKLDDSGHHGGDVQFNGATLQLNSNADENLPSVEFKNTNGGANNEENDQVNVVPGSLTRDRPGSTMSRRTTASTGSMTSMSRSAKETDYSRGMYFCRKDGSFEKAVETCKDLFVKPELDGELRGAWLLTEIDHWDVEREKLLMLTDTSLINLRYDFITSKATEVRRILLKTIQKVSIGDIQYPEKSLMPPRDHGAVRLHFGDEAQLTFGQKWNPWCSDFPYLTFSHHRLIYNEKERETVTYNVDDFSDSVIGGINAVLRKQPEGTTAVKVVEEPINITTYASMFSMVFNQSYLGFNRDRGGVSF